MDEAERVAAKMGYPVVLRPAYTMGGTGGGLVYNCLLYTSDAADERSSVDLGGCRILKKKNTINVAVGLSEHE